MKLLCKLPKWLGKWTGHRFGKPRDGMRYAGSQRPETFYGKECRRCSLVVPVKRRKK